MTPRPDLTDLALAALDARMEAAAWPPGPLRDVAREEAGAALHLLSREAAEAGEDLVVPLAGGVSIRVPCAGVAL